ncbi:DUF2878 domain-containing protein [Dasania marina]|uniref:DUF2878 domain-containing protein n=1 Tax=Dasania marina TaxID=471499 RepID=UPI0003632A81|nr:DUF2878 domain-containing protein [Dasania marina]
MKHWLLIQASLFQIIWLACIFGGNQWLIFPMALLLLHFIITPNKYADYKVLPLALVGFGIDYLLMLAGVFYFEESPLWLGALWLGFVLNFGHSLKFLRRLNPLWLMPIGAFSGCYVYLISWYLGAVCLPMGTVLSGLFIAAIWALTLPFYVKADKYIRGMS